MTLQELLDGLNELPTSARSATIELHHGELEDYTIDHVRYDGGRVIVEVDVEEAGDETGEPDDD